MLRIKDLHDMVLAQAEQMKRQLETATKVQELFWPKSLGYSEKPADFTIAIAVQNGVWTVYPEAETQWPVYQGTTVQIVNTTGADVRVKETPDVYQGASPFTVAAFSRTTCTVNLIHLKDLAGIEINHTFEFPTENLEELPRVVTGGPKMVPTEPEES